MSILRFSDGITIDTSGELRARKLKDGWYVVGEGMLIPVRDLKDAKQTILSLNQNK